jgi:transcriptional regulator with XRE-family HTH domain
MFPDVLKRLRKSAGWSQEELGKKLGLAKSTISMYENGTREPSLEILEAIADIFNVDMNTLTDSKVSATLNSEMQEYLEQLKTRSEMKMLFKTAKNSTKEDIEKTVKIIEALRGQNE